MLRVFLMAALVACGTSEPSSSPGSTPGVTPTAGKVRELTGKVIASRNGTVRTLAVGAPIEAEDTIDTGTDGSVVIELAHNNALWSLESGLKARVDQSPAWALPKQAAAKPVDHATSSAGRHADRQGADTKVTAVEAAPAAQPAVDLGTTADRAKHDDTELPGKVARGAKPTTVAKDAKPDPFPSDQQIQQRPPIPPVVTSKTEAPRSGAPGGSAGLPESPDRASILAAMQQVKPKLRSCGIKGTIKVTFKIAPDGKVETAQIKDTPDHAADACVLAAVKAVTLPATKNGVSVSYPFVLD